MKKALIILCLVFLSLPLFATTTFFVETSRGQQPVVIPDGYTLEEVLLIIAASYYEQTWDYEELVQSYKEATCQLEILKDNCSKYIEENSKYYGIVDKLIYDYDALVQAYKNYKKTPVIKGFVDLGIQIESKAPTIGLGCILFDKIGLRTSFGFNSDKNFTFGINGLVLF